jgi:hypothetical protein
MKIADRIGFEFLLRLRAFNIRQPTDVMALEKAMKGRSRQVWDV